MDVINLDGQDRVIIGEDDERVDFNLVLKNRTKNPSLAVGLGDTEIQFQTPDGIEILDARGRPIDGKIDTEELHDIASNTLEAGSVRNQLRFSINVLDDVESIVGEEISISMDGEHTASHSISIEMLN